LGKDFSGNDFQIQFDFTKLSAFELDIAKQIELLLCS